MAPIPLSSGGSIEFSRTAGRFQLNTEQYLPVPRDRVFAFFSDAFQLERITPPWLHFSVLTPRPIEMRAGQTIDYRLRLHGFPIRWRTLISDWEPEVRFVDRQLRGPYRLWEHEHTFEDRDGGTVVRDRVHYDFLGGKWLHRLLIRPDLRRIFTYRQRQVTAYFEGVAKDKQMPNAASVRP